MERANAELFESQLTKGRDEVLLLSPVFLQVMDLDKDRVQEFVDDSVSYYEEQSIIGNGVSFHLRGSERITFSECRKETTIGVDTLNSETGVIAIRNQIDQIIDCEETAVIQDLDNEASLEEAISSSEFARDLFTESIHGVPLSSDNRLLLPDHQNYRDILIDEYGMDEYLPHGDQVPIYWFAPDIFQDRGFVVRNNVPVVQEVHGSKYGIVNERLDIGELKEDNSENRLMIHLGSTGYHPIEVSLWTKFSSLQTFDDESVCQLELPDPATV
ncbi:hypothetical protein EA462_15955 [Natrarchaeobius halalkaliphilus]|uniref:Uncharacterized protein n=1 Tax=Natrarchaeobius halalkaliphilus TaxID=1679091 RepID=A0A3N6LKU6_9EURY|nr:hypothetical protein [Natrarchaeobius halalkaliphilus]RQG87118.1 hypothetical protein EA462_15955 [Natrarchaeobius halalkaliphilus]